MMKHVLLFSTLLSKTKLNISQQDKNNLLHFADTCDYYKSGCENNENTLASRDVYVLNLPKFSKIKEEILNCFLKHIDKYEYENNFTITTSWVTRSAPGQIGEYHKHMNSFLSGIYYLKVPVNSGFISFCKFDKENIQVVPKKWSIYNGDIYNEKIEEDDIVFFPSCMHHKQLKNNSQDIRYSLAFNFMPKGKTGRGDSVFNY